MHTSIVNTLPQKEANLLRKLFKFYETKQYKKGIKNANQILEKFPDHPETNSLKGLFLYQTGEQEEGQKLAKTALMKNVKSELCWHILGIINRSQRKYLDAIGCYKNALKYDPENVNILRDLAVLQVHVRELDLHQETRKTLLMNKSNLPVNWVAFAVAEHLLGNHDQALKVLDSFRNVIKNDELKPYEKSELILYEVTLMLEMKDYKAAAAYLEKHDKSIVDRTAFYEYAAKAYIALGETEKADVNINALIEKYPENLRAIQLLQERRGLTELTKENKQQIAEFQNEIVQKYPTSQAAKRNRLRFLEGEEFRQRFDEYLRPFFIKGLPSVFNDIRELLRDGEKAKIIEDLCVKHSQSLEEKNTFFGSDQEENPCCLLWSYLFLAGYFNWKEDFNRAMEYIEKAIQHTPTLIELYTMKAKIFKNSFNYKLAGESADKARAMDIADRYPNNLTVKYKIRNNEIEDAEKMLKTFIRDSSDANIHELQYQWYEYELGNAHLRLNQFGPGLRQFKFIEKHFQDFYEDQFDFHTYCLRKYDLRAYVALLRKEDDIYNNKWYIKSAISMIKGLQAYDKYLPELQKKEEEEKKLMETMDAHERKRYKKEKEAKEKDSDPAREKLDLSGKKYLEELKDTTEEACKFASKLLSCNIQSKKYRIALFTQICLLYLRKGKHLVALKAYNKIANLALEDAEVHLAKLALIQELENAVKAETINADIKPILEEELAKLKNGSDIKAVHQNFKSSCSKTLLNEVKAIIGDIKLNLVQKDAALKTVEELFNKYKATCSIKEVVGALDQLREVLAAPEDVITRIKAIFKEKFNLSPIFNEEALNIQAITQKPAPVLV